MTLTTFYSFCGSCSNFVTLNSSIILTVVTTYGLKQLGLDNTVAHKLGTCCKLKSCCKFKNLAANKIKLLQIK